MRRPHVRTTCSRWLPFVAVGLLLTGCTGENHTAAVSTTTTSAAATITAPATTKPAVDTSLKTRSQAVLDGAIRASAPGCSAAVGSKGQIVWTGVRGLANLTVGDVITVDTVFDIGSVAKQFTATAILLLADEGKLSLDDPLSRHAPELPPWAATVTLGQLVHQTSGIPDYLGMLQFKGFKYTDRTTEEQALQLLTTVPAPEFPPGSQFRYSNSNYLLLGDIVRRVSGDSLPVFLNDQVFQPLDLAMVVDPVGRVPNKAVSYAKTDDGGYRVAESPWEQIGDGAIQTTPSQLVRWADNYRTGQVGGPRLLDEQVAAAVPTEPGGPDKYGAGIYVMGNGTLDHDGSWEGFVTAFRISKDRQTSLAITCNTDRQDPNALADALAPLWM